MFDYSKLHGLIIEKYGTQTAFAEACGVSKQSVHEVLKTGRGMRSSNIVRWCEALGIPAKKTPEYFFTPKV